MVEKSRLMLLWELADRLNDDYIEALVNCDGVPTPTLTRKATKAWIRVREEIEARDAQVDALRQQVSERGMS